MINIIEVTNGYQIYREATGGLNSFTVFVETWEKAQDLCIRLLEHEFSIMER